jgi:indoleamine 2,3-dioxygenase
MDILSPEHFLSLPRPDATLGPPVGIVDTSTLAAHDFDVDTRTGFMPPHPPLARLSFEWEAWEVALDGAMRSKLQLGDGVGLSKDDAQRSESWRGSVRNMPLLPIDGLKVSEVALRRSHHVLAWILHFYVHSLPPSAAILIPPPITIPLLQICEQIQLPPVITYSDDVLYNWALKVDVPDGIPTLDNLRCQSLFTGTTDEEAFYLCSARIELRGVEALELMRATMDETFVGDDIAVRRITAYLRQMSTVIKDLRDILLNVRDGCDPEIFSRDIRPWFRGADTGPNGREWVFEGIEDHPELMQPTELLGASAGQSSLIHALDIFFGVDKYSHSLSLNGHSSTSSDDLSRESFLSRMQLYMPRHHRNFLNHLSANRRPLRTFVTSSKDIELLDAYNAAVISLKEFRDAHLRIVALYIVGPARRAKNAGTNALTKQMEESLKGTGGTDLAKFLKGVRDRTAGAVMMPNCVQ